MNTLQTQTQPALRIQTPANLKTPAAVAMFGPAILTAMKKYSWVGPDGPGTLGLTLAQAARTGYMLREADLVGAVKTELALRYGARIDKVACVGWSGLCIAVEFTATVLPGQSDPFDILLPFGGLGVEPAATLKRLQSEVAAMLSTFAADFPRELAVRDIIGGLRGLARWAPSFDDAALLFHHVLSHNIQLCIEAWQASERELEAR